MSIASAEPAQLSTYTVQSGDTLSSIAGTSDPATIGMVMQLNGLTSSTIQPGMQLQMGDLNDYSSDQVAQFQQVGQTALNQDNTALAATSGQGNSEATLTWAPGAESGTSQEVAYATGTSQPTVAVANPYQGYSLATAGAGVGDSSSSGSPENSTGSYKFDAGDYFGAGLTVASSGLDQLFNLADKQGMPAGAAVEAESSMLGVQYGARSLLGDVFNVAGGAIAVGETYSAYSSGNYREATQTGGAALGAIAGAELLAPWGLAAGPFSPVVVPILAGVGALGKL